ncbi:MAG: hypothetical protein AAGC99_21795, partial [Pseudomonadota bacterium]
PKPPKAHETHPDEEPSHGVLSKLVAPSRRTPTPTIISDAFFNEIHCKAAAKARSRVAVPLSLGFLPLELFPIK